MKELYCMIRLFFGTTIFTILSLWLQKEQKKNIWWEENFKLQKYSLLEMNMWF